MIEHLSAAWGGSSDDSAEQLGPQAGRGKQRPLATASTAWPPIGGESLAGNPVVGEE
jgi:hypothetical protein